MEENHPVSWRNVLYYLKAAALFPQRRSEMTMRALQELLTCFSAVGTALIWPCQDRKVPWKVYYAGSRQETIPRWLNVRLDPSLDAIISVLQRDLSNLSEMPFPHLICLQPASAFPSGLWIVWTAISPPFGSARNAQEEIRTMLEALIEVESVEEHYFSSISPLSDQALVEALAQGDGHALSAFLSLTRLVGKAEMTAWGRVYQDVIETSQHMGAIDGGFGFVLPQGHGIGGHLATHGIPSLVIKDYRISRYRHSSIAEIVDSEEVRSVIALPVHSRREQEKSDQVAGILYAVRRTVKPFSLAERLLVQRATHLLEPLRPLTRPFAILSPGLPPISDRRAAWYKLISHAHRLEELESWVSQYIKGTVIVTDSHGYPYISARSEQLEHPRTAFSNSMDGVQVISLNASGMSSPGQVYLRSGVALPPPEWPDFFVDLVMGCNLVIGQMEQAHDHLARQREQWLQALLQEKPLRQIRQDGHRLGLPVEKGQLWVIAWPSQKMLTRQAARQRILVENIVLDQLQKPLLFWGDDIGIILLDEHIEQHPSRLREALLTQFAPHPLWIVYGARYHSLHDLKMVLTHNISLAQNARREARCEYLLDTQSPGLESLLTNPRLDEDLRTFATRLLKPLLEHDSSKGTELTTTFVLAQTLGSAQSVADELNVHVNTIRYRLRKAEDLLGTEQASPQERIAWGLASSIWMNFHPLKQTPS
ncbi:MAG: helix-turn-helix domain-containing protein [Ktedonobacteraceae bacterium]|nr:helix-turn-helix domain-containing protein [Ktedonobacteraceae bacterium]